MKSLAILATAMAFAFVGQAAAQSPIYNTITGFGTNKQYYYQGAGNGFSGDLFLPGGAGPVSKIEVVFVSTDITGGNYYVTATLWNDAFNTPAGSVTGLFNVPPLTSPHVYETWLLTFSPVNIPLASGAGVYGVSFNTTQTLSESPVSQFSTLYVNRATSVGTDYAGFSIDTNVNGVLEPNLGPPNQEWYTPSPTWTHANLVCALYQWAAPLALHGPSANEPTFTMERIVLKTQPLRTLHPEMVQATKL